VIALFLSWRGPAWLFSAWNPNVAVLPFGLALVGFAAVAAGNVGALPLAVLAASFAAQTHLGVLPAAAVVALAAGCCTSRRPARSGLPPLVTPAHRSILLAVALAAVVWTRRSSSSSAPKGEPLAHPRVLVPARRASLRGRGAGGLRRRYRGLAGRGAGGVAAGLLVVLALALAVARGRGAGHAPGLPPP
jgi:hypothetical protein